MEACVFLEIALGIVVGVILVAAIFVGLGEVEGGAL
jgi:hypothetical protein